MLLLTHWSIMVPSITSTGTNVPFLNASILHVISPLSLLVNFICSEEPIFENLMLGKSFAGLSQLISFFSRFHLLTIGHKYPRHWGDRHSFHLAMPNGDRI